MCYCRQPSTIVFNACNVLVLSLAVVHPRSVSEEDDHINCGRAPSRWHRFPLSQSRRRSTATSSTPAACASSRRRLRSSPRQPHSPRTFTSTATAIDVHRVGIKANAPLLSSVSDLSTSCNADFQFFISHDGDVSSRGHVFSLGDLGEDIQASRFLHRHQPSGNQDAMGIQGNIIL
jgi:hypothetical protein